VAHAGTPAQKTRWMPDIVAGRAITAVAVTETGAGSDVKGIRTAARRSGDYYVLNGTKMFITNGVHADVYFVAAKTSPDARPSQQISMFIVEKGTPGFRVSRALDKHGWRSSDTAELVLEDCRIPAENLLGKEGRGFYAIMSNFQNERTVIGAMAITAPPINANACRRLWPRGNNNSKAADRKSGSNTEFGRNQTETPISPPAKNSLTTPRSSTAFVVRKTAATSGNALSESGKSTSERYASCGATAASSAAIRAAPRGIKRAAIRKIKTTVTASQAI